MKMRPKDEMLILRKFNGHLSGLISYVKFLTKNLLMPKIQQFMARNVRFEQKKNILEIILISIATKSNVFRSSMNDPLKKKLNHSNHPSRDPIGYLDNY